MIDNPAPRRVPEPTATSTRPRTPLPRARASLVPGAMRYRSVRNERWRVLIIPLLIAAGLHALALLGFNEKKAPPPKPAEEYVAIEFTPPPPLEELEEPDPAPSDGESSELPEGAYVPMLADVPSIDVASDFVQKLDVSSLQPKPDLNAAKVVAIPRGVRQGSAIGAGLKNVFNLADLDRVPEPVYQPAPVFPAALKRDISSAKVTVEFIVGTNGKVLEARVVDATHRGFEEAAVAGVSRWQFRPGIKNGKKVNTRMRVPLLFRVVDE